MWLKVLINKKSYIFFPHIITNFRIHYESISSNKKYRSISNTEMRYFQKEYLPRYRRFPSNLIEYILRLNLFFKNL